MHQFEEARPVVRISIELYDGFSGRLPEGRGDAPQPYVGRKGAGGPSARPRVVPAPGGAALIEDKPARERI